ncbi:MAG TPA: CHASE2 domain-containing protein, partial [Burkholderiaceae bacterium]
MIHVPRGAWRALRIALVVAAVLLACAHAIGLVPLRFVTQLDLAIADARLRTFMLRTLDPRIVIVDVDEKSLAEVGRWPWGRDTMAALADDLFVRQRAAVVGFDLLFAEADTSSGLPALERLASRDPDAARALQTTLATLRPSLDYDARFARALAGRNAVLGYYLSSERLNPPRVGVLPAPLFDPSAQTKLSGSVTHWTGYASNLPVFSQAAPAAGFFNALPDRDGQVRSVPLIAELEGRHYEPLALAMLRRYTGGPQVVPVAPAQAWLPGGYRGLDHVELRQGRERLMIPVDAQARARVPFRGPGGPNGGAFEYVSAADLVKGRVAASHLAGKLVLVGSTAPGVYDMRATPVAEVFPGVEVHANLLSGLLDERIPGEPDWAAGFELLQLLAIATLLIGLLPRLRAIHAARLMVGL